MDTGLQTLRPLQVVPNGLSVVALTWDPYRPDDLLVAATDNNIWRVNVTSSGVVRTLLTQQTLPGVRQISWDHNGDLLVVGEVFGDVMWRVDPLSGARTTILSYPLPSVRCGAQNPQTGDYYIGTQQGLWRVAGVPSGTPSATLVAPTPSAVTSIAFDPLLPQFVLFTRSQDLYRLDMNTLVVEPIWTGTQAIDLTRTAHDGTFRAIRSRDVPPGRCFAAGLRRGVHGRQPAGR
ncbi:MAG TPA: hypothetical protein ENI87_10895 [bacterium]|nr:hypothetical protein [bacterium]